MAYTAPSIPTSGTTFAEFSATGAAGILTKLITAMETATAAPTTAPTLAASGIGGTLPAATYYVVITETNGIGETTGSPVSAAQAVTLGQDLVVTFPALQTGNVARNTYVGTSSTGPFLLAATGTTAGTLTISAPLPTNSYAATPPTVNGTALSTKQLESLKSYGSAKLQGVWDRLSKVVDDFNRGEPTAFEDTITNLRRAHVVFAALSEVCNEVGTLIDANAGTLHNVATPIGGMKTQRQWP